LIDWLN